MTVPLVYVYGLWPENSFPFSLLILWGNSKGSFKTIKHTQQWLIQTFRKGGEGGWETGHSDPTITGGGGGIKNLFFGPSFGLKRRRAGHLYMVFLGIVSWESMLIYLNKRRQVIVAVWRVRPILTLTPCDKISDGLLLTFSNICSLWFVHEKCINKLQKK